MESLNETIEKVLYFLSLVQNTCDTKRLHIEHRCFKCYNLYIKEWKTEQKRIEKEFEESHKATYNDSEERNKDIFLTINLEELKLADELLEKARAIRTKSKFSSKQIIKFDQISKSDISVNGTCYKTTQKDLENGFESNSTMLSHSRSCIHVKSVRNCKMVRSKSVDNYGSRKETVPNYNPIIKTDKTMQIPVQYKNKTLKNSEIGLVTNELYHEYKCSIINCNIPENPQREMKKESKDEYTRLGSGSFPSPVQQPNLSYKSFKSSLKSGKLNLKSNFHLSKDGLWYPFVNFKNRVFLFKWTKCNSFESFIKIVKLIYKIQEIMMWIDLLSILGKEIMQYVKVLEDNDRNVVRLCSYLSSIYHESLQRIPMLTHK